SRHTPRDGSIRSYQNESVWRTCLGELAELLGVADLIHAFMQADGFKFQRVVVAFGVGAPFLVYELLRQLLGIGFADLRRHVVIRYRCGFRRACRLTAAEQPHDDEEEDAVHDSCPPAAAAATATAAAAAAAAAAATATTTTTTAAATTAAA